MFTVPLGSDRTNTSHTTDLVCTGPTRCKLLLRRLCTIKVCKIVHLSRSLLRPAKHCIKNGTNKLLQPAGSGNSTAFAEAVFILNQNRVSVTLTSSGLQLNRLGCRFPCFGRRHIPAAGLCMLLMLSLSRFCEYQDVSCSHCITKSLAQARF